MPTPVLSDIDQNTLREAIKKMAADGVPHDKIREVADSFFQRNAKDPGAATSKTAPSVDNNQQSPAAAPQPEVNAAPPQPEEPFDPLAASRTREEKKRLIASSNESYRTLAGQGAANPLADKSVVKQYEADLADVDSKFKAAGIDPEVSKDLTDIPTGEGFSYTTAIPELLKTKETNPDLYKRQLASMKFKGNLFNAIRDASDVKTAGKLVSGLQNLEAQNFRQATKDAINLTREFVPNQEKQDGIIRNIIADKAFDYGIQDIQPDTRFGNVNERQLRALRFMEDTDPNSFKAFSRLMSVQPQEVLPGTDAKLGLEIKARELEMIGAGLQQKALQEKLTALQQKENPTAADKQEYEALSAKYEALNQEMATMPQRYPQATNLDAQKYMQEKMGSNNSVIGKTVLGMGEEVGDVAGWIKSVLTAPFTSDKTKIIDDLELLGDKSWTEAFQRYTPESDRLIGSDMVVRYGPELEKQLNDIASDSNLSDEDKRYFGAKAIEQNFGQVYFVPNDRAGKTNFTGKAIFTSTGDMAAQLLPQAALSILSGGAGNVSKARQLVSLFGSTYATAYNDYYKQALEQNIANPSAYATLHTGIEAATELINPDVTALKKILGQAGGIADLVNKIDPEKWATVVKSGRFGAIKKALAQTGKTAVGNALQETGEEVAGQVAGNIAGDQIFNLETGVTDGVRDTIVQTLTGMLGLGALSLPFNYRAATRTQKHAFYEMGMDPERFKKGIQADLETGAISQAEAQEKVADVAKAQKAVQSSPARKMDGTPMTDNEKVQYAFNQEVISEINELIKNVPEESKKELTTQLEVIQKEQAELLKPRPAEVKAKEEEVKPAEAPAATTGQTVPQESAVAEKSSVADISSPSKPIANERKEERQEVLKPEPEQQPLPTQETLSGEGAGTPGAVATEAKPTKKRLKKDTTDRNLIKRLDEEELTAYDDVMRYFANDGRIGYKAIQELFGGPSASTEDGRKVIEKEKRSRIGMLSKTGPQSIDQLAHYLWENQSDGSNKTTRDYFEAINEILPSITSRDQAVRNLVDRFKLREIEDNVSEEEIETLAGMGEIRGPFSEGWTKEEQAAWEKEGKSAAVAAQVAEVNKVAEELTNDDEEAMFEIIRAHQDENGEVDWDELESKTNGFDPEILNLPINVQNKLDELIKQKQTTQGKVAEGPGKSGNTTTKVSGSTDQKGSRQDGKTTQQKEVGKDRLESKQDAPVANNVAAAEPRFTEKDEVIDEYLEVLAEMQEVLKEAYGDSRKIERSFRKLSERGPKSVKDFARRLTSAMTIEDVTEAKARVADAIRLYKKEKAEMKSALPLERGSNYLIERLSNAARKGYIPQEAADLAIDLIRQDPAMFEDLAISITTKKDAGATSGFYVPELSFVKIFKGGDVETAVHELLHHTEAFLPNAVRDAILSEWHAAIEVQKTKIVKEIKNGGDRGKLTQALLFLGMAQTMQAEPDAKNRKDIRNTMSKYLEGYTSSAGKYYPPMSIKEYYQFFNPSEWWAVNASRIFRERANMVAPEGWLQKAKAFYQKVVNAIIRVFKKDQYRAVAKGLDIVVSGKASKNNEWRKLPLSAVSPVVQGGVSDMKATATETTTTPAQKRSKTFDDYVKIASRLFSVLYPKGTVKVYEAGQEIEFRAARGEAYDKSVAPFRKQQGWSALEIANERREKVNDSGAFYDDTTQTIHLFAAPLRNAQYGHTPIHEFIHPILYEINKSYNVAAGSPIDVMFDQVWAIKDKPGMEKVWAHMNAYPRNAFGGESETQKTEAVTEFLALVFTGQIDPGKLDKSTLTKFFDLLNKIFEAIGAPFRIRTAEDLASLVGALKNTAATEDPKMLLKALAARSPDWVGATADMIYSYKPGSNAPSRDAIKQLIKKWPKSGSKKKLIAAVSKITGLDLIESEALVDEVHGLPPTPPRPPASTNTGDQEGSYKKFVAALSPLEKEKPGWFPRMLNALKNLSAWGDNPYRFVSLIPEKIAKEYGVKNTFKIPLGRIFEKNSAGRGFLKVDAFLRDVIGTGKGRMKGQELKDFEVFVAAKRTIDRYETMDRLRAAGEDVNRSTGNITYNNAVEAIEYLGKIYGQDTMDKFEDRAQAMQQHANNMLLTLVDAGFLSKDQYDKIKAENDFYAPFNVVQEKLLADMPDAPVGVSGVVKRIKGIKADVPYNTGIEDLDDLAKALRDKKISADEYFNTATKIIEAEWQSGNITNDQKDQYIMQLENPGFTMNSILDAMANMIYKAEGIALKNVIMNRLHALRATDTSEIYIKSIPADEAYTVMQTATGDTRQVLRQLGAIPVPDGFAPVRYKVDGKDVVAAINKRAADKLNSVNVDDSTFIDHVINFFNSAFRTAVITLSGSFIVKNILIDSIRTTMLSRYGLFAGKGLVAPLVNAVLFAPQYVEAFFTSLRGNTPIFGRPEAYKAWMNSDSFSKGMFDDLFNQQKKIKSIHESKTKGLLQKAAALIDWPGVVTEQTHKIMAFQRGKSVEGMQSEMATTQLAAWISQSFNPNMTKAETIEALDKLNYEVQNMAGSPNFPATHKGLKRLSMFLQFFSAAFKGEMSDYRRVANLFSTKGEGVKLSAQERIQMLANFGAITAAIGYYAVQNIADDDDEEEFNTMSSFYRDNYINIPVGTFDFTDKDGNVTEHADYMRIPLRGLTSTINVTIMNYLRYMKTNDPETLKTAAYQVLGNTSPLKLHGDDGAEYIESVVSNFTPLFKFPTEHAFNRDTHHHIDLIPSGFDNGMLEKYKKGDLDPWEVKTWKTSETAIEWSQFIFETTGVRVTPITLEHMERVAGRPSKLPQKATQNPFLRSLDDYPVYTPKEKKK